MIVLLGWLGGLAGAALVSSLGGALGNAYADRYMKDAELEGILPAMFGAFGGLAVGAVLGAWLAVRLGRSRPGLVAVVLAVALVPYAVWVGDYNPGWLIAVAVAGSLAGLPAGVLARYPRTPAA